MTQSQDGRTERDRALGTVADQCWHNECVVAVAQKSKNLRPGEGSDWDRVLRSTEVDGGAMTVVARVSLQLLIGYGGNETALLIAWVFWDLENFEAVLGRLMTSSSVNPEGEYLMEDDVEQNMPPVLTVSVSREHAHII